LKKRTGSICASVILIIIVIFLASDVGFSLYNPNRFTSTPPICTLNIISGNVEAQTKDTITWDKAEDGMILEPGSRIRTAADSHASLAFSQGTMTKIEPDTDLIISKLEGNQDTQPDNVVMKQLSGKTWNQVTKLPDESYHFQIKTSSADVNVRGTLFSTEVDESGKTLVQTTDGCVNVSAQGREVEVYSGQQTEVEPGAAPSVPAPMPPARNELVFTIDKSAAGLVIDPCRSKTGYLPDGSPLNQISGSHLSPPEEPGQVIRIREPNMGEYTIVMHGISDGEHSYTVEGFTEGKRAFIQAESCNITTANETILKLHLDVLNGLLQAVPALNLESSQEQPAATPALKTASKETKSQTSPSTPAGSDIEIPTTSKEGETTGEKPAWSLLENDFEYNIWVIISIAVFAVVVFIFVVWKH